MCVERCGRHDGIVKRSQLPNELWFRNISAQNDPFRFEFVRIELDEWFTSVPEPVDDESGIFDQVSKISHDFSAPYVPDHDTARRMMIRCCQIDAGENALAVPRWDDRNRKSQLFLITQSKCLSNRKP